MRHRRSDGVRNGIRIGQATMATIVAVVTTVVAGGSPVAASSVDGGATSRVSVSSAEVPSNRDSYWAKVSANGRYVVFASSASNLVPEQLGGPCLYVRDRWKGTTTLVHCEAEGDAAITPDGRYIAFIQINEFESYVFVKDMWTGSLSVEHESAVRADSTPYGPVGDVHLSADGRLLVFSSTAPNTVPGDTNNTSDIFVRDRRTGVNTRISVSSDGEQANGGSWEASLSADGRYVAFSSDASNLVPGDTNDTDDPFDGTDAFVRDLWTGTTTRVSVSTAGDQAEGGLSSMRPAVSAGGRYVAFQSEASTLVPQAVPPRESYSHIYLRDRRAGTTERISVSSAGVAGNTSSYHPQISADGRYITYYSFASNLVPGDTNQTGDVFLRDRRAGTTTRVSVGHRGQQADSLSERPAIAADGRSVAFHSQATNLVPPATSGETSDVFVRDLRR